MKAPAFWWRSTAGVRARCLLPVGAAVGAVATRRLRRRPRAQLVAPVLCIGNPTVGGAGKTPVALAVARCLAEDGWQPVFLTRGHGGRLGGRHGGPVVVGAHHTAREVGDEALLLAAVRPTVVARDRAAGGRLAETLGDVIVMDDGFQNPGLAKTWQALVVDRAVGLGNGRVTPAGPLRMPLDAQAARADALILTDAGDGTARAIPDALARLPHFTVPLVPTTGGTSMAVPLLAFAGIGRPEKVFAGLERLGGDIAIARAFADHHVYTEADVTHLSALAARHGLRAATTRKDWARLSTGSPAARRLAEAALIVDVVAVLPAPLVDAVKDAARRKVAGIKAEPD